MKWVLPLWFLVNVFLYSRHGVLIVADSERYLEYGRGILSGFYIDSFNIWYVGYALFIAMMGGSVVAIIIAQYVLSLLAVVALYRTCMLLFDTRSAVITCILFICFPDISQWNSYVLTESLFTSFTCFSVYLLASIYKGDRRPWIITLAAVVILFTILIKPTGVALLAAVLVVTIKRTSLRIVLAILFFMLLNLMLSNYLIISSYRSGEIIYAGLFTEPPSGLYDPPASYPALVQIMAFILHHPFYWAKLFFLKTWYLLSHTRPFWSLGHNLFSAAALLLSYLALFVGLRHKGISRDVVIFAITFLLIHILSVGMTSDDWDGRFLIPMLPVIFIFSGNGFATWRYRKSTE